MLGSRVKINRTFRRGILRPAIVWAAMILQLHLALVTGLHNHQEFLPELGGHRISAALNAPQAADAPCPACQIARQGSVNVPAQGLPFARSFASQRIPIQRAVKLSSLPKARPSGRAPPAVA